MKRTLGLLGSDYVVIALFVTMIVLILMFTVVSAIPWKFTYLAIGRHVGPSIGLEFFILILLVLPITLFSFRVSMKLKKNKIICMLVLGLILSFLTISTFSLVFMLCVLEAGKKIDISYEPWVDN